MVDIPDNLIALISDLSDFLASHACFHVGFDDLDLQKEGLTVGGCGSVGVADIVLRVAELDI